MATSSMPPTDHDARVARGTVASVRSPGSTSRPRSTRWGTTRGLRHCCVRIRGRHGAVSGVLVVVDEHASPRCSSTISTSRAREPRARPHAPAPARPSYSVKSIGPRSARSRACRRPRCLRIAESRAHPARLGHAAPHESCRRQPWLRIEVDSELVGMIDIGAAYGHGLRSRHPRFTATHVRDVSGHNSSAERPLGKETRTSPTSRVVSRHRFWKNGSPRARRKALEHVGRSRTPAARLTTPSNS